MNYYNELVGLIKSRIRDLRDELTRLQAERDKLVSLKSRIDEIRVAVDRLQVELARVEALAARP